MSDKNIEAEEITIAHQACWSCKNGKRKCSKELPTCSRCAKLAMKCEYFYVGTKKQEQVKVESSPASSADSYRSTELQRAAKVLQALQSESPKSPAVDRNLPGQVIATLESIGETPSSVIGTYFQTVDTWLPIVSPEKWLEQADFNNPDQSIDMSCLLLCMALIATNPEGVSDPEMRRSQLYFEAKTLQTMVASCGKPSIESMQAGLLLSLYEQGHGMVEAAHITMAVCVRMAMKMRGAQGEMRGLQNTEFGKLWWGIVTLDRYLNQSLPADEIRLLVGSSSDGVPSMELPTDEEASIMPPPICRRTHSGISASTQPTTRMGPFCRAAEAAHLLGKVLEQVAKSTYTHQMDQVKSALLDRKLRELAMLLMQQAINGWEECCAAIGVTLSALLLLHERTWEVARSHPGYEDRTQMAELALSSATRMVIDISHRFFMDLEFINLPALPLPATFAVYRATMLYIKFSGDQFMTLEWNKNLEDLKGTLAHFGRRWSIGQYYLKVIDEGMGKERALRNSLEAMDITTT